MNEIEDGRVEDGELTDCLVCDVETHLYDTDSYICPQCQAGGWSWTKSQYVRTDDVIMLGDEQIEVTGEERWGLRVMIYSGSRTLSRRVNSPMLVRKP